MPVQITKPTIIIKVLLVAASSVLIATFVVAIYYASLSKGSIFCRRNIIRPWLRSILKLYGLSYQVYDDVNATHQPCIYISNHRSVIDFFLIGAVLPDHTRFFISSTNYRYWPLRMVGQAVGFFYIPTQNDPAGRTRCYMEAEKIEGIISL